MICSLNSLNLNTVMLGGMIKDVRALHASNALSPIDVTLDDIVSDVILKHPEMHFVK